MHSPGNSGKLGAILPGALSVGKNTSNQALGAVKHGMKTQAIQAVVADDEMSHGICAARC